ncbi:hypothetical protein OESDEN_23257 [Oesophagostomum dentatum]|uniref:G-protein coupled receptors family 1 profile domain-containing protein n=1 Tax=Oesophagostomum dentatum TaxID=61180 RepID=A0A0B1RVP0_OESDE|nr:hypothetical protein OESDEN_23257 [Oesophagostomum dentatum]
MEIKGIVPIVSTTIFVLAFIVNSFFIYIVCTKSQAHIGTYKYLMISFAVCNILYSLSEFISQPAVYMYKNSYMVYSNGFPAHMPKSGPLFLAFFTVMYGMNTALLALHFLFRYVVVCRPHQLKRYEKPYITFWSIPVVIWGFIYGFVTLYCFRATSEFYRHVEKKKKKDLE